MPSSNTSTRPSPLVILSMSTLTKITTQHYVGRFTITGSGGKFLGEKISPAQSSNSVSNLDHYEERAREDVALAIASYASEGSDANPISSSSSSSNHHNHHHNTGNNNHNHNNSNNSNNNMGNISNMGISSDDQLINIQALSASSMSRNRSFEIKDKDKETT